MYQTFFDAFFGMSSKVSAPTKKTSRENRSNIAPVLPVRDNVHFPQMITTLLVGREISLRALHQAVSGKKIVLVLGQTNLNIDEPTKSDVYQVGCLSEVVQVMPMPDGMMRVVLRGLSRAKVVEMTKRSGYYKSNFNILLEEAASGADVEAMRREAIEAFQHIATMGRQVPIEVLETLASIEDVGQLTDLIIDNMNLRPQVKQEFLEEIDVKTRLKNLVHLLTSERQVLELQTDLRHRVESELGKSQREYFLREQLKVIQNELNPLDGVLSPENELIALRIADSGMPEETMTKALDELKRLEKAPSSSPESMVIRTWIEWLLAMPWQIKSQDRIDIGLAKSILEQHHHGLTKVKDRILEFLAVRQVTGSIRGPILCFAGPPGVGKTSIGRSIAESLDRKFVRVSVGGVRDEAEIRGHRRTYIGAQPGRIIQGIKQAATKNPVFMLDEIDKMTMDFRGDPTSALLEALDPEQNYQFSDHYLEVPFDLSEVMFVLTANWVENIPGPLRDRMEFIHFPSYTEQEKCLIAKSFLVPKNLSEHGLKPEQCEISDDCIHTVVRNYTREAGVRGLNREIATICRKSTRNLLEGNKSRFKIDPETLTSLLGQPRYRDGNKHENDEVGAANGLAYTEFGGDILTIEVALMPTLSDEPKITLTGSLGTVMKESALAAVTFIRSHQSELSDKDFRFDVHLHVPEGAVPKDGPSAGVTMVTALASAFSNRAVRKDIAMTGEVTLRGNVLPVGGIREKVLAASRAGLREVILPTDNKSDTDEVPETIRKEMTFHFVSHVNEVLKIALLKQ